jgi:hypothetical protein
VDKPTGHQIIVGGAEARDYIERGACIAGTSAGDSTM